MRQGLSLSPRLECSGCNLSSLQSPPPRLKRSSHLSLLSGWDCRSALLRSANFLFFVEMGSQYVTQAGLKLLNSRHPPTWASQSAGITGVSPHVQPLFFIAKVIMIVVKSGLRYRRAHDEGHMVETPSTPGPLQLQFILQEPHRVLAKAALPCLYGKMFLHLSNGAAVPTTSWS